MHGVGLILFLLIGIVSGSWGPAAVVGVVVGVVCFMVQEDGKDMRAYYNARDYWANGGPERHGSGQGR